MKQVSVTHHKEDGTWWAEAEAAPGFSALADSLSDLRVFARDGLEEYFGESIEVEDNYAWLDTKVDAGTANPSTAAVFHHTAGMNVIYVPSSASSFRPIASDKKGLVVR